MWRFAAAWFSLSQIRFGDAALRVASVGARLVLWLTAALLIVMPWTEYFCNFDRFLRGGQDVEFGLLALLMVFSLMLVLFQRGKTDILARLNLGRLLAFLLRRCRPAPPATFRSRVEVLDGVPLWHAFPGMNNLPFQV